ncbi:hypothetical protein [Halobacillus salinus]|nr:hypothetical protein [Halobacillus salinus]
MTAGEMMPIFILVSIFVLVTLLVVTSIIVVKYFKSKNDSSTEQEITEGNGQK